MGDDKTDVREEGAIGDESGNIEEFSKKVTSTKIKYRCVSGE